MSPEARARIGELAEKLLDAGHAVIALLDEFDGDADREDDDPCGTEPAE
jgi:hypothetical protein